MVFILGGGEVFTNRKSFQTKSSKTILHLMFSKVFAGLILLPGPYRCLEEEWERHRIQWEVSTVCDDADVVGGWPTVCYEVQSQHNRLHGSICWHALWKHRSPFPVGLSIYLQCQNCYRMLNTLLCFIGQPAHDLNPVENSSTGSKPPGLQ